MARFPGAVLLDNNSIGDAVDIGVWKGLLGAYANQLETVTTVEAEAGSYFVQHPDKKVLLESLSRLKIHSVSGSERATLAVKLHDVALDPGERDLWAHGLGRQDAWILCGPDKASVRAAVRLGLGDRIVSMEQLLSDAGLSVKGLKVNQTQKWLEKYRTEYILEYGGGSAR